ncbi:GNAT family N-acetyltransferase [Paraburkholderia sp. PREW-6R]|uniref:GNAT family N-acetyltransferase n=1 Tax=Paraburkholderia sp. PREW-6R TaxID=3141544 RepID=UPI0031F5381F
MQQNEDTVSTPERSLDGLTLRALRMADADQLHALLQLPAVVNGNPHVPFEKVARTREYIEKADSREISIVAMVGETLVGHADLSPFKGRRAHAGSIGISVHDAWHRRGIGTALMSELLDLADNWLGLRRVELHVFADNQPALALYRKCGFEIEARQRGAVLRRGVLIDCYFMARLREPAPLAPPQSSQDHAGLQRTQS